MSWIYNKKNTKLIISICTGSLFAAASGLLKNKKATTHWSAFDLLKDISPSTSVLKKKILWIKFFSSGVASGIDLSLKVVENFYGKTVAKNTAKYMEYRLIKK